MDDIFSHFGDIFGDSGNPFESFFGGGNRRGGGARRTKGSNIRVKVKLNLSEIANGVTKKLKLKKMLSVILVPVAEQQTQVLCKRVVLVVERGRFAGSPILL